MTPTDRRTFLLQSAGVMAGWAFLPELAAAPYRTAANVKAAVIGAGRQGRQIVAQLQKIEGVEIAALCDSDESRLRSGLRRVRGLEGFSDHQELLKKRTDIQAIFVATPTHLHKEICLNALKAGRHVYCESPLAHTIEDAQAIAAAARAAQGKVFQAGFQGRSNPVYKLARSFFRSDSVRDLVSMRAQRHEKKSWRSAARDAAREKALNWRLDPELSTGLAGEWGAQQFDVVHWFTGRYPAKIRGGGGIRLHDDGRKVFDSIYCDLIFENGTALQYEATLANSYQGTFELLCGTNAAIKLAWSHGWMFKEADAPTQGWEVYANRQQFHNDEGITLIADATKLSAQGKLQDGVGLPHPSLYYALVDFLASVTEGKKVRCTADEGVRATTIGILANQAITTGDTVTVDAALLGGTGGR